MQWLSAISEEPDPGAAVEDVVAQLKRSATGDAGDPDLLLLFASPPHTAAEPALPKRVLEAMPAGQLAGCSGGGIIGDGREIEHKPALSLSAAWLPDVAVAAHHLETDTLPSADDAEGWRVRLGFEDPDAQLLLFADPFSFDPSHCLSGLDAAFPNSHIVGGLASGAGVPGGNVLFAGARTHRAGAVLLSMRGNVVIDPLIAQGCKAVGEPMLVTSCDGHLIPSLGNRPPGEVLQELHDSLPEADRELLRRALFLGIEMRDQTEYRAGDFLIRNIMGLHEDGSTLAVANEMKRFQAVQFHVRDAQTSAQDLTRLLDDYTAEEHVPAACGAMLFSCLGRGEGLYQRPNHDSDAFRHKLGRLPVGGFFCNGEIGPVGDTTYMHGYTSAFAVFRPRR